jgi:hypothetical protein
VQERKNLASCHVNTNYFIWFWILDFLIAAYLSEPSSKFTLETWDVNR